MSLNALTIDLEEYFQVSNFDRVIERDDWGTLSSRVAHSTDQLLELFERVEARATFFVLGWVAERHPDLVRRIAELGHEIACHGYGHELVYEIGPTRFREDLRRAKTTIEDACGRAVRGYRAPSYSITNASLWALDILAEEGFEYDSSIFPIHHHRYGIPEFPREPQRLVLRSGATIDEFPLTTLRMGSVNVPLAGGAYLRFLPGSAFRWGFRHLAGLGQPTVLYLHPWEVDPDQPRQRVGWKTRVNHYFNLSRTLGRLDRLLRQLRFRSMEAVLTDLRSAGRLSAVELERIALT